MYREQVRKIAIRGIDHYAGARFTRRTWYAVLIADTDERSCSHTSGGHRTTSKAAECGRAMWSRLQRDPS